MVRGRSPRLTIDSVCGSWLALVMVTVPPEPMGVVPGTKRCVSVMQALGSNDSRPLMASFAFDGDPASGEWRPRHADGYGADCSCGEQASRRQ
jgi:hypothetical protein